MKIYITMFAWVGATALANILVAKFGPAVSIFNAFALVGLALTSRDVLHEAWAGRHLAARMGALIAVGGVVSFLIQADAGRIAIASVIAFGVSETFDALVYQRLIKKPRWMKANGSNVVGAALDSILFPLLAFGAWLPLIMLGQFVAKVLGGALWIAVFSKGKAWCLPLIATGIALAVVAATPASGANAQVHHNEHGQYVTVEHFQPGQLEAYGFIDQYFYGPKVTYGEIAVYANIGDVAATMQIEAGDSDWFDIEEVLLAGVRWNGLELLLRSDEKVQLTYVWFIRRNRWQFNGYIDVWGRDEWQAVSQPQVWWWINDHAAIGSEVFCEWNDSLTITPSIAIKLSY